MFVEAPVKCLGPSSAYRARGSRSDTSATEVAPRLDVLKEGAVGAKWQKGGVERGRWAFSASQPVGNRDNDPPPATGKKFEHRQCRQGGPGFGARREEEGRSSFL